VFVYPNKNQGKPQPGIGRRGLTMSAGRNLPTGRSTKKDCHLPLAISAFSPGEKQRPRIAGRLPAPIFHWKLPNEFIPLKNELVFKSTK